MLHGDKRYLSRNTARSIVMSWTIQHLEGWIGRSAIDPQGHRIGTISDVYVDDATGQPEWLAITTGLFGTRMSFVPLAGSKEADGHIVVAFNKSVAKGSPHVEANGQLSLSEEQ